MTNTITICPEKIPNFGSPQNKNFSLIVSPDIAKQVELKTFGGYNSYQVLVAYDSLKETVARIPPESHILVITPDRFINSIEPSSLGKRKLGVIATNSTPTSNAAINHFLRVIEQSDPHRQAQETDHFFAELENSDRLSITNPKYQTQAYLKLSQSDEWHEQQGELDWGEQQILPSGEISVLPMFHGQFDASKKLQLNGKITLHGRPIVHSGSNPNREKQQNLFARLSVIENYAIIATVISGEIVKLESTHELASPAVSALQELFSTDSNYRIVWELGLGINTALRLWEGNSAMNEVYGGRKRTLHLGLGLTPTTEFHIDLLCPESNIAATGG